MIPHMNVMYCGFYPVPILSGYNDYINWVSTIPIDIIGIGVDDLSTTTSAAYYPFVDKFSWKFDEFGTIEMS